MHWMTQGRCYSKGLPKCFVVSKNSVVTDSILLLVENVYLH